MNDNRNIVSIGSYLNATGPVVFGMTNDYMFHAVLQKNVRVLKGLICSLLHLQEEEVQSVQILNPIELGQNMDDKTFILDINVMMNNKAVINLEMQMANEKNWEERSLSYLCRSFDQLYEGQDYIDVKPAIHIGFINFSPYENSAEFYATYKMLNVKNHRVYSDKFVLRVVDLTHIELATEEDKENQLDYWAKLFTATSWEELKMIAEKNPSMSEATQTLYELNADERTQEICRARREYYRRQNTMNRDMENLQNTINKMENSINKMENTISDMENTISDMEGTISDMENKKAYLENEKAILENKNSELQGKNDELQGKNSELQGKNDELQGKNSELQKEIAELRKRLEEMKE